MKIVKISDEEALEDSRELFTGGKVYLQMLVDRETRRKPERRKGVTAGAG